MAGLIVKQSRIWKLAGLLVLFASLTASSVGRSEEATLPGGATSLNEAYGDWTVSCVIRPDAQGSSTKLCILAQEQVQTRDRTRQRVLHVELRPESDGAKGTLVLPFGLDLSAGVKYRLDDGKPGTKQFFRTCLPVGCLVGVDFDAHIVEALKSGKVLKIISSADADGGQETVFSVSLTGFSNAYERVTELQK